MLSGLGGYSKEYKERITANAAQMRLFCSAFSMEKLSLCQGDEPLAAEGVKFSSYAEGQAPRNIFLDRRTEVHKAKKDGRSTASVPKNGLAVIDGRSHAEPCDNVEH